MWLQWGLIGGGIVVLGAVLTRLLSRRSAKKGIDVGSVSEAWLAEHRGRRDQS